MKMGKCMFDLSICRAFFACLINKWNSGRFFIGKMMSFTCKFVYHSLTAQLIKRTRMAYVLDPLLSVEIWWVMRFYCYILWVFIGYLYIQWDIHLSSRFDHVFYCSFFECWINQWNSDRPCEFVSQICGPFLNAIL